MNSLLHMVHEVVYRTGRSILAFVMPVGNGAAFIYLNGWDIWQEKTWNGHLRCSVNGMYQILHRSETACTCVQIFAVSSLCIYGITMTLMRSTALQFNMSNKILAVI